MGQAQLVYVEDPVTTKAIEDGSVPGRARFGVCGMQGWRRNMEDAHLAVPDLDGNSRTSLFGVFDGHGGRGVSRFVERHLPDLIRETESFKRGAYAEALKSAFLEADVRLRTPEGRKEVDSLDVSENPSPPIQVPRSVWRRLLQVGKVREAAGAEDEAEPAAESESSETDPVANGTRESKDVTVFEDTNGVEKHSKEGEKSEEAKSVQEQVAPANIAESGKESTPSKDDSDAKQPDQVSPEKGADEDKDSAPVTEGADGEQPDLELKDDLDLEGDLADEEDNKENEADIDLPDEEELADLFSDDDDDGMEGGEEEEDSDDDEEDLVPVDPTQFLRDPSPEAQGCTAVVALVDWEAKRIYCANSGDSRCILRSGTKALALSEDHKPELEGETKRIEAAGGHVQPMRGGARVMGDLNLSRAIGDLRYKTRAELPAEAQIVTADPEIMEHALTPEDNIMVLGCDGIWERNENQGLLDSLRQRIDAKKEVPLSTFGAEVCDETLCPPGVQTDGTGYDNMTILIVEFQWPSATETKEASSESVDGEPSPKRAKTQ